MIGPGPDSDLVDPNVDVALQDLLGSASSAQVAEGMALHTIKVAETQQNPEWIKNTITHQPSFCSF